MYGNRVVITGLGAISPIGNSAETYWENLKAGVSGVDFIKSFDASEHPVKVAAEALDFVPEDFMDKKASKRMARHAQFSVAAAGQAIKQSGLTIDDSNAWDVGAMVATGGGGFPVAVAETEVLLTKGWERVSPMFIPLLTPNMAACQVSMTYGIKGPVVTTVAACAAGLVSFFEALHFLRRGDVGAALVGGTEAGINPLPFISLARAGALSTRSGDPTKASRPFDADRAGFVFGEGASVMVLETLDHARARGAQILAEVVGAAITADAYHVSAPEPSGESAKRAMLGAIKDAELKREDIDYICAHGTGTPLNDATETKAIKLALGDHAYKVAISSPKSMVGHLLGAAGAISALTCVRALQEGVIPMTLNLETPDPECDLDYTPGASRNLPIKTAMANGFGFGGQNASVVFKKWEED